MLTGYFIGRKRYSPGQIVRFYVNTADSSSQVW